MVRKLCQIAAFTALTLLLAAPAQAIFISIDFDDSGGTPGAGWNVITSADSNSTVALLGPGGNPTGISLTLPTLFDNDGTFDGWLDGNPLPAWAPEEAVEDLVYLPSNGQWFTFRFSGLDPNVSYNIDMVVSRNVSVEQDMRINGGDPPLNIAGYDSLSDGYLPGDSINWPSAHPTSDGELMLRIRRLDAAAAINALRIWSTPEPSPGLLLGPALLLALVARERARRS